MYTSGPLLGTLLRISASAGVSINATSADVNTAAESRSVDFDIGTPLAACGAIDVPGLNEVFAYREIGLNSTTPTGVRKRSVYAYQQ